MPAARRSGASTALTAGTFVYRPALFLPMNESINQSINQSIQDGDFESSDDGGGGESRRDFPGGGGDGRAAARPRPPPTRGIRGVLLPLPLRSVSQSPIR